MTAHLARTITQNLGLPKFLQPTVHSDWQCVCLSPRRSLYEPHLEGGAQEDIEGWVEQREPTWQLRAADAGTDGVEEAKMDSGALSGVSEDERGTTSKFSSFYRRELWVISWLLAH